MSRRNWVLIAIIIVVAIIVAASPTRPPAIGMDAIAIALMFCWAAIMFLLAFLYRKEYRELKDKLKELEGAKTEYRRRCFSVEWNRSKSRRKIIAPRSIYMWIIVASSYALGLLLIQILGTLGYAMFVPFLGIPMFLDNALEMYFYSRAVRKQSLKELQPKDQEYMEVAIGMLATRPMIYSIVGVMFSIAAPFIPSIFCFLAFVIAMYARPVLFLVERIGLGVGVSVVILCVAVPTVLFTRYHKWIIRQIERIMSGIIQKLKGVRDKKRT